MNQVSVRYINKYTGKSQLIAKGGALHLSLDKQYP